MRYVSLVYFHKSSQSQDGCYCTALSEMASVLPGIWDDRINLLYQKLERKQTTDEGGRSSRAERDKLETQNHKETITNYSSKSCASLDAVVCTQWNIRTIQKFTVASRFNVGKDVYHTFERPHEIAPLASGLHETRLRTLVKSKVIRNDTGRNEIIGRKSSED